jgi:dCMP deaminase
MERIGGNMNRPNWDQYWMQIASDSKSRSTCLRRHVGAVLVKNNQILSMGYNGAPSKTSHCEETGCLRQTLNIPSGERAEICRAVHAEQNAIIQAAKNGVSIDNSVLYVTTSPCNICAKMLINAGVKEIVYLERYPDKIADKLFASSNIILRKLNE